MRLAVIDNEGQVIVAWPTVGDAHQELADRAAEAAFPHRFQGRRRARTAAAIRAHLLDLQARTVRL